MRLLFIAAACALVAAGSAAAQTRGLAPTTSMSGAPAVVQTGHTASMPGPAAKPSTMAGSTMATHSTTMSHTTMHTGMRHHMGRHHRRSHSAAYCTRRATARHLSGVRATHYIERCQAGRHHRRHGHGMAHHAMAKPMTTTTTTTHTAVKPAPVAKPAAAPKK